MSGEMKKALFSERLFHSKTNGTQRITRIRLAAISWPLTVNLAK